MNIGIALEGCGARAAFHVGAVEVLTEAKMALLAWAMVHEETKNDLVRHAGQLVRRYSPQEKDRADALDPR